MNKSVKGKLMKMNTKKNFLVSGILSLAIVLSSNTSEAAGISIPGDFPGTFAMDLLAGDAFWDFYGGAGCADPVCSGFSLTIDTTEKQILFDAIAFDGVGAGEGTSQLALNPINDWFIGSGMFGGFEGSFYVDGSGVGTLVDNADSTAGHWTLEVPMYALWNGTRFDFNDLTLSTNASYNYYDTFGVEQTLSGSIMDYATGDAFLVGQSIINDPLHPFNGLSLTLGFFGNDPIVTTVPMPAAVWLFGSGLIGLIGVARRKA